MTEDNLALDIPIETLFKYLLKDYHREQQRTLYLEGQIKSVLKRNAYLEQEIGKVKQQLLKKGVRNKLIIRKKSAGYTRLFPAGTIPLSNSEMRMPG